MIVKCGKYHILFLGSLLKFSHTAAGPKFVKKLTFNLGVDFRLKMCYPYIVRKGETEMRIYAIQRKADKKIVFSSASRRVIFDRFNKYHDRENYRIVILERG
jgi:hypothetical protein